MADGKSTTTEDLDALVDRIGAAGASDRELLSKALDGIINLSKGAGQELKALIKGMDGKDDPEDPDGGAAAAEDDPDAGGDPAAGDDPNNGETDDDVGGPGFEDYRKGGAGGDMKDVDVTELLEKLNKGVDKLDVLDALVGLPAEVAALRADVTALRSENAELKKAVDLQTPAITTSLPVLAKAVAGRAAAVDPATKAGVTSAIRRHLVTDPGAGGDGKGGAATLTKTELLKGRQAGILSELDVRYFQKHGQLSCSPEEAAEAVAAIKALG